MVYYVRYPNRTLFDVIWVLKVDLNIKFTQPNNLQLNDRLTKYDPHREDIHV